ncbi:MAG: DUF5009 domain-containing protein [Acidobacteria bacterium]|nr:DUF5009 domain-containing protein [Acidobacteriota bacterium]
MILVNNPGSWSAIYWPLAHAEWNGWTPTDLIFPFFLFIVGVSMIFSFGKRGSLPGTLVRHTIRRSIIIYAVGFSLAAIPYFRFSTIRIPGVLARIAVCYLFAAIIVIYTNWRTQAVIAGALILIYWALMTLVPVPGYGAGDLSPEGNLGAYIDRTLMLRHLWKPRWDPEGLLSTMPALATTLLGALMGHWLRSGRSHAEKLRGMFLAGAAGLVLGQIWNIWFPINKNIWTSSYVLFTGGFAAVCLAICYWVIDVKGWKAWSAPFLWFGMNSIFVFAFSGFVGKMSGILRMAGPDGESVTYKTWFYETFFTPYFSAINASLAFAIVNILFFMLVVYLLYRAKIFIKV